MPSPAPDDTLRLRPLQMGRDIGVIEPSCSEAEARVRLKSEDWLRRCALAPRAADNRRKRKSVAWFYGEELVKAAEMGTPYYYCYLCEEARSQQGLQLINNGTDPALTHLEEKHQINRKTGEKMAPPSGDSGFDDTTSSIASAFRRGAEVFRGQFEQFKDLLIRWMVCCHIAYFQLENVYFRELLFFLWPPLEKHLPRAANTIRQWVLDAWKKRKVELRKEMRAAHSRIHISFDLWTSSNHKAIVGIIAHFINASGKRRTEVIGLREIVGEHSAENIGHQLLRLFIEYGITHLIGFFMCDNAEVNDKCVAYVLKKINPSISKRQIKRRRLRCFGHIVNLCAQAFLMGKDAEKICKDLDAAVREGDWKKIGDLWRKRGSIGRLHNLIRYIRATPQRRNRFMAIVVGGEAAAFNGLQVS